VRTVRRALELLSPAARRQWATLVPLAVLTAGAEAVGAVALYALIRVVGDPALAASLPVVGALLGGRGEGTVVLALAAGLAAVHVAKNLFQAWAAWVQSARVAEGRAELARRLLAVYLGAPWAFHLRRNSAELIRNVSTAVDTVYRAVLAPAVTLAAEALVVAALALVLACVAPGVTLALVVLLGGTAALLLRVTRARVRRWGRETHRLEREVLQGVQQTLGAVKEIKVLGREAFFRERFGRAEDALVRVRHLHGTVATVPRLLVETVFVAGAFGLVALVVLLGPGGTEVVPLLGLYAYAGFRVIPSVNRIMLYVSEIRSGGAAVDALRADLAVAVEAADDGVAAPEAAPADAIVLDGVSFTYEGAPAPALAGVELEIRRGESVGVVGTTGAGKSTLVDVLIGLLQPTAGRVLVDGRDLRERRRAWQRAIGYVPQAIVLVDDTLRRNVALGVPDDRVDEARVREAIGLAQLEEFVASLPAGLDTVVGERGVRLSGGQRQRVGIARALYHRPAVLVFDEATSALDNRTEAELLGGIERLRGARTLVVVAHRLTSVRPCDRIVVLAGGRVVGAGTYDELLRENAEFRRLAAAEPAT
jgi:ATP-binding cassette subfamily C protein